MIQKISFLAFAFISVFLGTSCSPNVFVVDESGKPLEDAYIRPLTRSFNYNPISTGAKGSAYIRQDLPTIETLLVSKSGYLTADPVNFNLPKPITVVLKKR